MDTYTVAIIILLSLSVCFAIVLFISQIYYSFNNTSYSLNYPSLKAFNRYKSKYCQKIQVL